MRDDPVGSAIVMVGWLGCRHGLPNACCFPDGAWLAPRRPAHAPTPLSYPTQVGPMHVLFADEISTGGWACGARLARVCSGRSSSLHRL